MPKHFGVDAPQKSDRIEILAPAVLVWDPAGRGTAVVKIEHGRDGIDAQPVNRVAVKPKERVRQQEIRNLDASVVIDQGAPVEMTALPRIGMLVERSAVEGSEPVGVVGEMTRHPVEHDAESGAMADIDEICKFSRASKAAGWRKQSGRLITPGAVEGVLAHRQELDVAETKVAHISRQRFRKLAIGEPSIVLFRSTAP